MAEPPDQPLVLALRSPSLKFLDEPLSSNFHVVFPDDTSPDALPIFIRLHAATARAIVIIGRVPVTSEIISLLPSLEIIVLTSVGTEHVDLDACKRRGILVTNSGRAFSEDVADSAVGLLISVLRRITAADRYVRLGLWERNGEYPLGFKLGGKRVGIVGLGSIGTLIAKRLVPFGCIVSYNSRTQKPDVPYRYHPDILSLASDNDALVLCCPLTDQTHHLINKEVMKTLGRNGIIINVGRGGLVDEKEMVSCLVRGEIGGAGLDVFEDEPNVPEEMFGLDTVVMSPHVAVNTPESLVGVVENTIYNLRACFSNQPLHSQVRLD